MHGLLIWILMAVFLVVLVVGGFTTRRYQTRARGSGQPVHHTEHHKQHDAGRRNKRARRSGH